MQFEAISKFAPEEKQGLARRHDLHTRSQTLILASMNNSKRNANKKSKVAVAFILIARFTGRTVGG